MTITKPGYWPWLILLVCVINLTFTFLVFFKNSSAKKIAYIDAMKLVTKYDGTIYVKANIEAKAAEFQSKLDTLRSEYESANENFLKNKSKLPQNSQLEMTINRMREQYDSYQQVISDQLQKEEKKAMDEMLGRINKRIEKFAIDRDYSVVLSGAQLGTIAYADKELDITDEILGIINREYNAK
ncbi:MAG: OmpH family outer membrane protein [Chryseolinea sp.]